MNLTVSQRIWGGFVFITFLLILIGGNSLGKIANINQSTQQVNQLSLPALSTSSKLQVEFVAMGKIALQSYYTSNESELNSLKNAFEESKKNFESSYNTLSNVVKNNDELRQANVKIKDSFAQFTKNVDSLFNEKMAVLTLRQELSSQLGEVETNADDASTAVLDIIDETDLESKSSEAFKAATSMETNFLSLVSNSTDMVTVKNIDILETLHNEQKFSISDLEKGMAIVTKALEDDDDAASLIEDLTTYFTTLKQYILGSNSLVENKKNHLNAIAKAKSELALADSNTKKAISQLENLVEIANTLAFELQEAVDNEVSEANLWTWTFMIIASIIAIAVAYLTVGKITKPLAEVNRILETVASGDMTQKLNDSAKDEFGELASSCNSVIDNLRTLIQGIISRSTQLAAASEETSTITAESSQAIQEQRSQVGQAATATTEMSSTSQAVTHSAREALNEIKHADSEAERVKSISALNKETIEKLASEVDSASVVINQLHKDSSSIGSILDVIRGIAEQTNLLALNAAIEAARAGEQGRGFAVVADEVRSLASKTQESTQEIQAMIESLQSGAEQAVSVMSKGKQQAVSCVEQSEQAADALAMITQSVSQAHDMSEQISTAAQEQHQVSQEISERLESIVSIAEQAASGADQTSTASQEVAKLAEELRLSVDEFKV